MLDLIGHMENKEAKNGGKRKSQKVANRSIVVGSDSDKYSPENTCENFYSLVSAASLLGVAMQTVENWIKQDNIEKKVIITDRKRVYISHSNVIRLADLYERKISLKEHADLFPQREADAVQPDMDKLYSIKEAALCLNASQNTVRTWIKEANIEKMKKNTNRTRAFITHKDILRLADLHQREIVLNLAPMDMVEEIKEIKKQLNKHDSAIRDIIHDLRIIVKRSIYVGD